MTRAGLTVTRAGPGRYSDTPGHLRLTRLTLRLLRALWVRWFVKLGPDCPECLIPMEPVGIEATDWEWAGYQCPEHVEWVGGKSGAVAKLKSDDVPLFCQYAKKLKDADGRYLFPPNIYSTNERRLTAR